MHLRPASGLVLLSMVLCAATCPGSAPTAVLTAPATIELGAGFTLDGSGSTGSSLRSYRWTSLDADGLANLPLGTEVVTSEASLAVTLTPGTTLPAGRYVFSLVVEDGQGQRSAPSMSVIEVRHGSRPTAVIHAPTTVTGSTLVLDGTASFAAPPARLVEYRWTNTGFTGGQSPFTVGQTLGTATPTLALSLTGHPTGFAEFQLEVVDEYGLSSLPDTVRVGFAAPGRPTAVLQAPPSVELGAPFTLLATGSFASAGVRLATYRFTSLTADAGVLSTGQPLETSQPQLEISAAPRVPGRYDFQLEVTDELGGVSLPDQVSVMVRDGQSPTAVLDGPANVSLVQPFELSGARSFDVGGTVTEWTFNNLDCPQLDGWPVGADRTQAGAVLQVSPADGGYQSGTCTFALVVRDDSGNPSSSDRLRLTMADRERPTAVISGPARVSLIASFTLDGARSFDTGGGHLTQWIFTNQDCLDLPGWSPGTSLLQGTPIRPVLLPVGGLFTRQRCQISLSVVDDSGNVSLADTWAVLIVDDQPPTAVMEGPASVAATSPLTLSGAKSFDVGGQVVRYTWTNLSLGGVEATFPIGSSQVTTVPGLTIAAPKGGFTKGSAHLSLVVTDDSGNTSLAYELAILVN